MRAKFQVASVIGVAILTTVVAKYLSNCSAKSPAKASNLAPCELVTWADSGHLNDGRFNLSNLVCEYQLSREDVDIYIVDAANAHLPNPETQETSPYTYFAVTISRPGTQCSGHEYLAVPIRFYRVQAVVGPFAEFEQYETIRGSCRYVEGKTQVAISFGEEQMRVLVNLPLALSSTTNLR